MNTNINVRVEAELKEQAQDLFNHLGLDLSTAIKIFLNRSVAYGGIPFEVCDPQYNAETMKAIRESEDILSGKLESKAYHSARELFDELDKEMEEC